MAPKARVSFSANADGADHEAQGYQRKGNEVSVKKVIDTWYSKILEDPMLRPVFSGVSDMARLRAMQQELMTFVFGGKENAAEDHPEFDLRAIHMGLLVEGGLGLQHWGAFVRHFQATLDELDDIPEDVKAALLAWIGSSSSAFRPPEPQEVQAYKAAKGK